MTAFSTYDIGTVSVSDGDTQIVGSTVIWDDGNAKPGDKIVVDDLPPIEIKDAPGTTQIQLWSPWTGGNKSGVGYTIIQCSPQRFASVQQAQDVVKLVAMLNSNGLLWYLPAGYTDPNAVRPAMTANDGQGVLRIDTGELWVMSGGTWVSAGTYKGFAYKGAYDPGTAYVVNDVLTSDGSAYLVKAPATGHAPPNATYYDVFASKGDTGATGETGPAGAGYGGTSTTSLVIGTGSKAFTTQAGLAYTNGARVRAAATAGATGWVEGVATYSGTTLTITSDKTGGSGTGTAWNLNLAGEPGAGDVLASNNLSDLASAATAASNLGVVRYGGSQSLSAGQQTQARSNIGAALAPTPFSASLSADVALTTQNNVYDAVSVAQGTTGTFLVIGRASVVDAVGSAAVYARLSDGTNVLGSSGFVHTVGGTARTELVVTTIVTNPAGNIRLQCANTTRNGGTILWNATGQGVGDTRLDVIRIA